MNQLIKYRQTQWFTSICRFRNFLSQFARRIHDFTADQFQNEGAIYETTEKLKYFYVVMSDENILLYYVIVILSILSFS